MYLVGLALVIAFICVFREIRALIVFLRWHRKDVYVAEVGELIHTEACGKNRYRFTFLFFVGTGEDRIKLTYEEVASDIEDVNRSEGYRTDVYYDPERPKNDRYRFRTPILRELKGNPVVFVICVAFILVYILVSNVMAN